MLVPMCVNLILNACVMGIVDGVYIGAAKTCIATDVGIRQCVCVMKLPVCLFSIVSDSEEFVDLLLLSFNSSSAICYSNDCTSSSDWFYLRINGCCHLCCFAYTCTI